MIGPRARACIAIAVGAAAAVPAQAQTASTSSVATTAADPGLVSKKDRALRAKSPRHGASPAPGSRPARLVNFYNAWTKEWLAVDDPAALPRAVIDHFLRDHFTNQAIAMEPRLIAMATAAARYFRRDVVQLVSAFRHPKYNLVLRKKGHQVARDSQHSHGTAIDFSLPKVTATALHAWATAQQLGGVGFYPDSGFVHMDTGPIRTWSGE